MLRAKMNAWIDNGAALARMIDPDAKTVEVCRPGQPVETLADATVIVAGAPVEGFRLDLAKVWNPLSTAH